MKKNSIENFSYYKEGYIQGQKDKEKEIKILFKKRCLLYDIYDIRGPFFIAYFCRSISSLFLMFYFFSNK